MQTVEVQFLDSEGFRRVGELVNPYRIITGDNVAVLEIDMQEMLSVLVFDIHGTPQMFVVDSPRNVEAVGMVTL